MKDYKIFYNDRIKNIKNMNENSDLKNTANDFIEETSKFNYSYNFDWLSRPIIQYPQDIVALQEIIWK